jgi:DNA-binding transcriptional LysR family regulator
MRRFQQRVCGFIKQPTREHGTTNSGERSLDVEGIRTFVVAAELGRFQDAADELDITPQAVSKRIAVLERTVGATLFVRSVHGVELTVEGRSFLPHASEVLRAADRARRSVQPQNRALRVDVTNRRVAPSVVLQGFHRAYLDVNVEVVTLVDNTLTGALSAVQSGSIDAAFRAVTMPDTELPHGLSRVRAVDDELEVLVGPGHQLAAEAVVTPHQLRGFRVWIPGIVPGTEWAAFYDDLAAAFDLTIDGHGPHFGDEALMEALHENPCIATLVGKRDRYVWPDLYGLRRIPVRNPAPVYPHSLIWHSANQHPGLAALCVHLDTYRQAQRREPSTWLPSWAAQTEETASQ